MNFYQEATEQEQEPTEQELSMNIAQVIDTLKTTWMLCVIQPHLFYLANELYTGLQAQRLQTKLNKKAIQRPLAQFLLNPCVLGLMIYVY